MALPCPAVGGPTLRFYRPWRCFLRVGLSRSKPENGADKGLQGRLWPGIWHPLASLWPAFGTNLAVRTASKRRQNSIRQFITKMIEKSTPGLPKSGQFLRRKNRVPDLVFGPDAAGCPRASPGAPKASPRAPQASLWGVFGVPLASLWPSLGSSWAPFGFHLAFLWPPWASLWHPLASP